MLPELGAEQLLEMAMAAVDEAGLKDVSLEVVDGDLRISMHGPLLFEHLGADIQPGGKRFLDLVARIISRTSNRVEIHGHTDSFPVSTPAYPTNWELSAARAVSVGRFLIEEGRVGSSRIAVTGHAMYRPASPNLTEEAKARNRRVEIVIRRPETAQEEVRP